MARRWNCPPGWPTPPDGWSPPEGWRPDPEWPAAPAGWQFWIDDAKRGNVLTRHATTTTGLAAGFAGLILGFALGSGDTTEAEAELRSAADERIARVEDDAAAELDDAREDLEAEHSAAMESAVDDAVRKAVAEERSRQDERVERAVAKAVKKAEARAAADREAAAVEEPAPASSAADPRFGTCGEAQAAGYGHYRRGVDVEYDWYQDRDGDGVVCE